MKKAAYWGIGVFLLVLSVFLDKYVISLIGNIRTPLLDSAMKGFDYLGGKYVLLLLLTFLLFYDKSKRKWIVPWWVTFVLSLIAVYIIKLAISRERPEAIAMIAIDGFSFPSGHATAAFSSIPLVYKLFKKMKIYWLVYVLLIAFSRIYLGVHYLSDVVAGALLGLIVGVLILKYCKRK